MTADLNPTWQDAAIVAACLVLCAIITAGLAVLAGRE